MDYLVPDEYPRGYIGAFVLRGEGLSEGVAGRIKLVNATEPMRLTVGRDQQSLLGGLPFSDTKPLPDGTHHLGAMISWNEAEFAMFAFDMVAILNGTYRSGYASSLHGMSYVATFGATDRGPISTGGDSIE